jgi:hypothetical protein
MVGCAVLLSKRRSHVATDCLRQPEAADAYRGKTMLFQYCLLEWALAAESAAYCFLQDAQGPISEVTVSPVLSTSPPSG